MSKRKLTTNPIYYLKKPAAENVNASRLRAVFSSDRDSFRKIILSANELKYIYWDKFQYKPLSGDLTAEEQWMLVKLYRDTAYLETPIRSKENKYFKWIRLPAVDETLHKIDMLVGGQLFPRSNVPLGDREMYINRGVIEEAIASSQLEGAHTTRAAAKEIILEKRKPRNKSEQMIVNNYKAMKALEEDFKDRKLSEDFLFELHSILTDEVINKNEQKRFRKDADDIVVEGDIGTKTYTTQVPPNEQFLKREIKRLIGYANDELEGKFTHPIIKAIFIHFWFAYLHPFTDGNGRIARALFYWYLLKHDYWTFTYLPISAVIKKSPIQYAMAYIYSEQDSEDLTYFLDYNMRKVVQSISDFEDYVEKQIKQNKKVEKIINEKIILNERQKQLVFYFISDQRASTTTSHSIVNNVARQTAAKDLKKLEDLDLIQTRREGKYVRYYATDKLKSLAGTR